MRHLAPSALVLALALVAPAAAARAGEAVPPAGADTADEAAPAELAGVAVTEKLGAQLPLDTMLTDETGAPIRLGSLFGDGLPVVLTFNYSSCPMLCSVQLGGLVDAMRKMTWAPGVEYRVVTVILDPKESHRQAMDAKLGYLGRLDKPSADAGWRFLTGKPEVVRLLADTVGFGYHIDPKNGQVYHPAALMLLSPSGKVSHYVYGVEFDPTELRSGLIRAGLGEISESTTKFLLACFHYEPKKGFALVAMRIMRIGGLVFLLGFAGAFLVARMVKRTRATRLGSAGVKGIV